MSQSGEYTFPIPRGSLQHWIFASERGRNILFLWNLNAKTGGRTHDFRLSKQAYVTTTPAPQIY